MCIIYACISPAGPLWTEAKLELGKEALISVSGGSEATQLGLCLTLPLGGYLTLFPLPITLSLLLTFFPQLLFFFQPGLEFAVMLGSVLTFWHYGYF